MKKIMRYVGMDVHAETIAIAVVERNGTERELGTIPNRPEAIRKCLKKGADGDRVHRGRADADPDQGRRSGEDRPARCAQAGALAAQRGVDGGVGAGRGA